MIFRIITISFFLFASFSLINSQDCSLPVNTIFGSSTGDERGISLSPTLQNDGFYVAGRKDDSTRIMKFDLSGEALWSRTFDIIPGKEENVNSMLLDSEGMLAISGTGGSVPIGNSVFVFRYDPDSHSILWANEYIHTSRTNNFSIIQLGSGGNYLVSNNPYYTGTDDSELLSLNINTGNVEPGFSMNYDLGASEILSDVVHSGNFIYGTGRYTDGSSPAEMRNAIVKLNSEDGSQVWVKLGHRPASASARLYATDLIVDKGFIYSVYQGDASGTSTLATDFFVQKTTVDGELVWLNQYDLPGANDDVYEIIKSGNGYVIMAGNRAVPTELELFKIDPDGGIMWARKFEFESVIEDIANLDSKSSQLISVGNKLIFTGFAQNATGGNNMFLIITNLEGETNNTCITNQPLTIPVIPVTNPTFYSVSPDAYSVQIQVNSLSPTGTGSGILVVGECTIGETIETNVNIAICEGEVYEGYSQAGTFIDTFLLSTGCDSIRTLQLTVNACQPECDSIIGSVYGTASADEIGISIAFSPLDNAVYVTGTKEDSTIIIKMDVDGAIVWVKAIDIHPNGDESPTGILVDSDGMLAIVGTTGEYFDGGDIYVIRYDPASQTLLWANTYNHSPSDFSFGLIQKGNGNYVITSQATFTGHHEPDVIEIDKTTGAVNNSFAKNYSLFGTESLYDIAFDGNFIYGVGRYKDGGTNADMRNTIVKLDPVNGNQIWVRLGHLNADLTARLYGTDLIIEGGGIYSTYFGDPDGTSISNTLMYIQKTDREGNLIWLNQYDLPGDNDISLDIIRSGEGLVVLGYKREEGEYILFKVDSIGNVLWGKSYLFDGLNNPGSEERSSSQLIQAGNQLLFTGFGTDPSGNSDIIIARTDLEGNSNVPCIEPQSITIPYQAIANPTFYEVSPEQITVEVNVNETLSEDKPSLLPSREGCLELDSVQTEISVSICEGEVYEGYSTTGIYVDTFLAANGCDSIRTLTLTVNFCQPECGSISGPVYGSPEENERGYCIVATPENDGLYVAGIKEDSLLLLKIDLNGGIQWTRTFDLIPDNEEYPYSMLVDSDGMIVLSGTVDALSVGGGIFVLRYDPYNHQVLWQNDYVSSPNSISGAIIQKGDGGNYVMTNDLNFYSTDHIDVELLEIDKNTGAVIPTFAKTYRLTDRESLFKIVYDGNFIYGAGRYKEDDFTVNNFRNTIVKINPDDGNQVWVKMGHIPDNTIARLYGAHILVDQNEIISGSYGDPDGTSVTSTNLYLQKTSLDGNVIWLKQYLISETNAYNYGIIKSGNGYIILAGQTLPQSEIVMFKIDREGAVLWAKTFDYSSIIEHAVINPTIGVRGQTKIVEAGNKLFFVGYGENFSGRTDMLIVSTDLDGEINLPCVASKNFPIEVVEIDDPVFFSVSPDEIMHSPAMTQKSPLSIETFILPREECLVSDTIMTTIEVTICAGQFFEGYNETGIFTDTFLLENGCDSIRILDLTVTPPIITSLIKNICHDEIFEGYTISGIYSDTFALSSGCDSIRILHLTAFACAPIIYYDLNACRSYMIDGSHMDYSEFVATYPEFSCAEITAEHVNQIPSPENKHSCTPGVNNTIAMCVGSYGSCTYSAGNPAAILIDFSVNPHEDSLFRFSALEFYEKAPPTYTWIDGPSGPNNYPLKYGIRILKNGVEIFRDEEIQTSQNWTLQSFNFIDNDLFRVEENAVFRIELLPYCPVGNGADVSAWDIDEIRIFGACAPIPEDKSVIFGNVITMNVKAISDVEIKLSEYISFVPEIVSLTDEFGTFSFDELETGKSYFLKGYNNDKPLNGVSTLDLILIQKHLLGIIPFNTLNNYVAADANHSGNVSIVDLVEIQKLLLGKYSSFPQNTSWRFGVWPQNMNSSNISSFTEIQSIEYLASDSLRADFIGVKIGDINGDVHPNAHSSGIDSRSANEFTIWVEERKIEAGANFVLEIKSGEVAGIAGMQFALDMKGMNLASIMKGKIPVGPENYSMTKDGLFRFSWSTNELLHVAKNEVLFAIVLNSIQPGLLSEKLELSEELLSPEAYTYDDLEILKVKLVVTDIVKPSSEIDHFTVEPNPFNNELKITLNLIKEGNVEFNFYDISGRLIHRISKMFQQGEHTLIVGSNQLPVNEGVIYCQLKSNGFTSFQKLIKLE